MKNAVYIEVSAEVRYWDDATINGVNDDVNGTLVPCRDGELWRPVISLDDGVVTGWPEGVEADIHYKVCDQGEYWLLDRDRNRIAKWRGHYVPDNILCVGDEGYGDYIIMTVTGNGSIADWKRPVIDPAQWEPMTIDENQTQQTMRSKP